MFKSKAGIEFLKKYAVLITAWAKERFALRDKLKSEHPQYTETAIFELESSEAVNVNTTHKTKIDKLVTTITEAIAEKKEAILTKMFPLRGKSEFETEYSNALAFFNNPPEKVIEALRNALDLKRTGFVLSTIDLMLGADNHMSSWIKLEELRKEILADIGAQETQDEITELAELLEKIKLFTMPMPGVGVFGWADIPMFIKDQIFSVDPALFEMLRKAEYPGPVRVPTDIEMRNSI